MISYKMVLKKFVFFTMVAMEAGKRHFFSHLSSSCKEEKMLDQKHECYRFEPPLKKLRWLNKCNARKNVATSK